MKGKVLVLIALGMGFQGFSQDKNQKKTEGLLKELAENACKCVDSVSTYDKSNEEVAKDISSCINNQTGAYHMGIQLLQLDGDLSGKKKETSKKIDVSLSMDENSKEYKEAYYQLERYMAANCSSVQEKMASNNKQLSKSFSENKKALDYYYKGIDEAKKGNDADAVELYKKALSEDAEFAFAWDNLGLSYRKLNEFDKAIESYEKSLALDPNGKMPLQNVAIVYIYKKEYEKGLKAYERLSEVDSGNPEVFYGIGTIYTMNLQDFEKGLIICVKLM